MEESTDHLISFIESSNHKVNLKTLNKLFKNLRFSKMRRSDLVSRHGPAVIESIGYSDNEKWIVLEQALFAFLDTGHIDAAKKCCNLLKTKFPKSLRVKRSEGMIVECEGNYTEALMLYNEILEKSPLHALTIKRKACIYKAMGKTKEYIAELNKVLEINAGDIPTWLELSEVYIERSCDFEAAAYCLEEVILIQPTEAIFHTRLAEIYYSLGGIDNIVKSRIHYSMSLNLKTVSSGNLRAAYGAMLACKSLLTSISNTEKEYSISSEILKMIEEDILSSCGSASLLLVKGICSSINNCN